MKARRSIELNDDMRFQRRTWAVERVGWILMGVVIVAAAAGLFGVGPLSWATVRQLPDLAEIDYGRFQRQTAPATIRIKTPRPRSDGVLIEVDSAFLNAYKISSIWPQPVQSTALAHGVRFRFDVAEGMPATIVFHVSPQRMGFFRPKLTIAGAEPVELPVFIFP
jgi:hypothetical protein